MNNQKKSLDSPLIVKMKKVLFYRLKSYLIELSFAAIGKSANTDYKRKHTL